MMTLSKLCALSLIAACLYVIPATAATTVEGVVKDSAGRVLNEGPFDLSDIPELLGYLKKGGLEAELSGGILAKFGSSAVPEIIDELPGLIGSIEENNNAANVVSVLRGIKDDRLIEPLSLYINHQDNQVAGNIKGILVEYGDPAVPVMLELLEDPAYQNEAMNVLGRLSPSENKLQLVRPYLKSDSAVRRSEAAELLGTWRDELSDEDIVRLMLGDPEPAVRRSAAKGYFALHWEMPDGFDADALIKCLEDPDPEVRNMAVDMLGRVTDERLESLFIGQLGKEKDRTVLASEATLLANMNSKDAIFPLIKLLDKNDPDQENYQTTVIWALGELKAAEAVPYLVEPLIGDAPVNESVITETLTALLKIGEPLDLHPLLKYLDPDKVGDHCCGDEPTDLMLKLIHQYAKPGDDKVKEAVERFRSGARDDQLEEVDAILEKI